MQFETRDGLGNLVDPLTIDRELVEPHRLGDLDAWISAQSDFADAEAQCDECKLELETALNARTEWVKSFGTKFSVSFRDVWEASRHKGGDGK